MATPTIPELREAVDVAADNTDRLAALLKLGQELRDRDPREGFPIAIEMRELAEQLKDDKARAKAMVLIGSLHWRLGEYPQALEHMELGLSLHERLGERREVAVAMGSIGVVFSSLGEYTKALERFQSAMSVMIELDDRRGIAIGMGNLATVYSDLGEYARALEQDQLALVMFEELGHQVDIARATGHIGGDYFHLGEYTRALEYYQRALELANQSGSHIDVMKLTQYAGNAYAELGEYAKALVPYRAALSLAEELGNGREIAITLSGIGGLYRKKEFEEYNLDRAEQCILRAVGLMTDIGARPLLHHMHGQLAELYKDQGRWQEAHDHLARSHELKEELHSAEAHKKLEQIEHLKQIAEMEKRRAVEQAEEQAQRESLKLQAQLLEVQLDRQRAELASQAMHLAKQTEMLGEFRNDLRTIMRQGSDPRTAVKQIREKLKELPCEAIDWTKFDAEFRQTYPEFQTKLVQRCPELSGMEMKVCALLKLKLTSADISKLLCLSERSVEGHRLHIRRKMGLAQGEDVHAVLASI